MRTITLTLQVDNISAEIKFTEEEYINIKKTTGFNILNGSIKKLIYEINKNEKLKDNNILL